MIWYRHVTVALVVGTLLGHAGEVHAEGPRIVRPPQKSAEESHGELKKSPSLAAAFEWIVPTVGHDYAGYREAGKLAAHVTPPLPLVWSVTAWPPAPQEGDVGLYGDGNPPPSFAALQGSRSSSLSGREWYARVPQRLGPTLVLLDSIVLQETAQSYIGNPMTMFLGPDSSLYVIDSFAQTVMRFDQTGQQIRTYGGAGEGPGEFRAAGRSGFASRTVLGVTDGRSPPPGMAPTTVIEFFDVESGDHAGSVRTGDVSFLALERGILWVAGIEVGDGGGTVATREFSPLLREARERGGANTVVSPDRVPVPRSYLENSRVRGLGGFLRMHVGDQDTLLGFAAIPFLLRVGATGEIRDTIPLLGRLRAWVRNEAELNEVMDPTGSREEVFSAVAPLVGVSRDANGRIFTVHQGSKLTGERQITGTLYASSLSGDGRGQCPDTLIPTSDMGRPISTFRGNEIFVLDRRIHSVESGDLRTVVRRFRIDPHSCTGQIRKTGN